MGYKALVFLGFLVAMALLISSEVAARELAETTNSVEASQETEETEVGDQYGGGYGGGRGGRGGYGGGGRGGYGGGRGGRCRYGCCGGGRYGGGCRCCSYAGQAVDPDFVEDETQN
ncbi:glycine-rich protein-like isoform X2 [Primulina tabacum]|uniref:glycine-rich protein-like isoform X2 n=1 Tax=Primulina tabacum TaxID=48773 RepID=UPI003F598635